MQSHLSVNAFAARFNFYSIHIERNVDNNSMYAFCYKTKNFKKISLMFDCKCEYEYEYIYL